MYLRRDFFNNLLKVGGATIIAQAIGIITIPIFSRLFSPDVVGEYALFTSFVGIIGSFSTGRYELAVMIPKEKDQSLNIVLGTIIIAFVCSLFSLFAFLIFHDYLASIANYKSLEPFFYYIPIFILLSAFTKIFLYWFIREKKFTFNAKINIFSSFASKLGNIGAGSVGYTSTASLVFVNLAVLLIGLFFCLLHFIKNSSEIIKTQVSLKRIKQELIRYKRFPLIDLWSSFLDTGSILVVPIILSFYFSSRDVGLYSQSLNLIQLPIVIIASAFGQVFLQRLSEAKHENSIPQVMAESLIFLSMISIPLFTILYFWGEEIVTFILGNRWSESGIYVELLAPWCCLKMLFSPTSSIFTIKERQDTSLIVTTLIIVLRVVSIFIGGIKGSCYLAILLFSISGIIGNIIGLCLVINLSKMKLHDLKVAFTNNPMTMILTKTLCNENNKH